ncbi:hypothetical protein GE061_004724 [Apolygus lucorum]|uniref:Uncharacterized protein n=1 Tax=Apolygus lucorum TaxID=248454 RepID=A0A8S9X2M4_APOLU|nr:hypothetical protein GE061_004724 [Apolygus lucorum]
MCRFYLAPSTKPAPSGAIKCVASTLLPPRNQLPQALSNVPEGRRKFNTVSPIRPERFLPFGRFIARLSICLFHGNVASQEKVLTVWY